MRICYFAEADHVHSQKWIRYFAEQGEEIHWISLHRFKQAQPGVRCYSLVPGGSHPLTVVASAIGARRLVRRIDPDLTHVHYLGAYGMLGLLAGRKPLVATAWGSDVLLSVRSAPKRAVVKRILNKADLITCDAEHVAAAINDLAPVLEKTRIINFGVDTDLFAPGPRDGDLAKALGLGDGPVVISLRNFDPVYDVATLIRAAPAVIDAFPETRFLVLGSGPQAPELQELARTLGVKEHMAFPGRVPNSELPCYLRLADVYASTALSDAGIAASTAEAMACGVPVVVTASGENHRWIEPGKGGFLVPRADAGALAEAIVWLLKEPEARKRFGQVNRETVQARNDYRTEMAKMMALYEELTQG